MTRVTGAVMAHPQRLERARALAGDVLDVVTDPDPAGQPSAFRTSLLAWSSIPDGSTHHFLLHDDMVLSDAFFERVQRAAEEMPGAALALFAFWNSRNGAAVRQGALAGARWVPAADEYMPVAAIMLPRDVAHGYVEWARDRGGTWPDDVLMYRYLKQAGVPRYVAVPSLAEHEDMASLVDNDFQGLRRSVCFFQEDPGKGAERPGLAELSAIPFFKLGVAQCAVKTPTGWRTIQCEEYLRRFDIELPRREEFGEDWGVWLTAFTMGVVNRFEGHGVDHSGLVLDQALATIGPGGLCHRLGAKALADLTPPMHKVAWDGLRFGLAMTPKIKDSSSLSVRVACAGSFVGDYLRHTLADRGYHVTEYEADVVIHQAGESATGAGRTICLTDLNAEDPEGDCVLRLGVAYGPGMPSDQALARFVRNALLNRTIDLTEAESVQLVHVKDIADAVEAVLYRDPPSRVYDIANPDVTTPEDLCVAIGQSVRPVRTEGEASSDRNPVPVGRAEKELGWRQSIDLHYGLHTYSQWLAYETED
jgi:hypothetical protein